MMEQDTKQSAGNGDWATREQIACRFDSTAAALGNLDRRVRPYLDAHPFVAVGLATAVGFLLGRLVSRS